jgi:hypothetical protein
MIYFNRVIHLRLIVKDWMEKLIDPFFIIFDRSYIDTYKGSSARFLMCEHLDDLSKCLAMQSFYRLAASAK